MKFFLSYGAVLLPFTSFVSGIEFNPDDEASIRSVTAKYAAGLMSYYKNGAPGTPENDVGIFPKPHYWWEAGAAWGGLIEYTSFTGDKSYVNTLTQALVSNYGPNNDILLPWRKDQEGNDDQAFWALGIMSALEYSFPEPNAAPATYLEVVKNCFDNIASRWDTTSCGGGLKWQIYPENSYGYDYKNSISNGAFFALAARLASYTGNKTYSDWAVKTWDWTKAVGLINDQYAVFDGTDDKKGCSDADHTEWSYNVGIYLHGAAAMYAYTKGSETWQKHTAGLLDHTATFFKPFDNATDIMFEQACETGQTGRKCNVDQQSFKAYLARFMAKTALLAPFTKDKITNYLRKSAVAAAKSCSGGKDGVSCGSKWYTGGWDGTAGVGQQLSALEVTQALLMIKQGRLPDTKGDQKSSASPSASSSAKATSSIASASSSGAAASGSSLTAAPSTATATFASSGASNAKPATSSGSSANNPVPSSTQGAAPSFTSVVPGGVFAPQSGGTGVCTCTPSSTVTIYVPPTSAPIAPPPAVPTNPSGTVPVSPPVNATSPGTPLFTGAATNTKATSFSIFGAVAVAVLARIW
ncbi:uncharacterized protein BDR25DRAFT_306638 [Lindgomyces ingoldianus]|uniref:Uncharacterized protein n=1 Tax=Lindgomyces ingoldianus TaxID=673940 RepID=A0ACB6QEU8_9PLEO|nr:uncharacterized protein BDR25DRAFT_306638 [Lindgomyces ingoldianus]KAF2465508.1 hypothetical protein BDR25DRAFT_306638 [Lindgomyces ingoldianus]